jgi:hypothetical protein
MVALESQLSLWRGYGRCEKSAVARGSHWLLWEVTDRHGQSQSAKEVHGGYGKFLLAMRDTGRCGESVVPTVVRGCYEESLVAMEVIGCGENQWLLWKSLVAKVVHLLLWKASGRFGEVMAVVESRRPLREVIGCCGKSLAVTDSHRVLRKSMVAMGSHCLLCETLVAVERQWFRR